MFSGARGLDFGLLDFGFSGFEFQVLGIRVFGIEVSSGWGVSGAWFLGSIRGIDRPI